MDRKKFKAGRIRLGLTQQEFGELMGFSKTAARIRISEIERGDKPISKKTALIFNLLLKKS